MPCHYHQWRMSELLTARFWISGLSILAEPVSKMTTWGEKNGRKSCWDGRMKLQKQCFSSSLLHIAQNRKFVVVHNISFLPAFFFSPFFLLFLVCNPVLSTCISLNSEYCLFECLIVSSLCSKPGVDNILAHWVHVQILQHCWGKQIMRNRKPLMFLKLQVLE